MKKFIVLCSGLIIAAGAAAQAERSGVSAAQPERATLQDRQIPTGSDRDRRANPAAEPPESANSVSPDFQGSSEQAATSSGMGQPQQGGERKKPADKTGSSAQDVEDKTRK